MAREALAYRAYQLGSVIARALPLAAVPGATAVLGAILARTTPGRRAMIARHLARVHGDVPPAAEVDRAYHSYARYWIESFRLPGTAPAVIDAAMSYEGVDNLDAALGGGRGAILALPHLGGWDFGGAWLATRGYPVTVVVEPLEPVELYEWFAALREEIGMTVVPLGADAGTRVSGALKRNGVVGLVSDRGIGERGVEVEFFGERTTLPSGPATLALRSGAPILPTAVYFQDGGRHRGVIQPPLDTTRSTASLRQDVARVTQDLALALEALISVAPDQWHLFQPNWPSDFGRR